MSLEVVPHPREKTIVVSDKADQSSAFRMAVSRVKGVFWSIIISLNFSEGDSRYIWYSLQQN